MHKQPSKPIDKTRPTEIVRVLFDYKAQSSDELDLKRESIIEVLSYDIKSSGDEGWWLGKVIESAKDEKQPKIGIFPSNFVQSDLQATLVQCETDHFDKNDNVDTIKFEELKMGNLLGSGGFGSVFKAIWRNDIVAVKVAHKDLNDNESQLIWQKAHREARLFHSLKHKNIVNMFGVSRTLQNSFCLVMEYCGGGTLFEMLQRHSRSLSAEILVNWAIQISRGMLYLHEEAPVPLVHRDLKSSNILIKDTVVNDNLGEVCLKITDFGLAREADASAALRASVWCGTYAWMAPEIIRSYCYTKASDVWSFGVVLWELLTGEIPYKNIDGLAVAYGIAVQQLKLPIPSSCPPYLTNIMQTCWSLEPHKRPSFGELLQNLVEFSRNLDNVEKRQSMQQVQKDWRVEIQRLFQDIKCLEKELAQKELELREMGDTMEKREELLRQREAKLLDRQVELTHRELQLLLLPPNEPPQRRGRKKVSKPQSASIGHPTSFRSLISVKNIQVAYPVDNHNDSQTTNPSLNTSFTELRVLACDSRFTSKHDDLKPPTLPKRHRSPRRFLADRFKAYKESTSCDIEVTPPPESVNNLNDPPGGTVSETSKVAWHRSSPNLNGVGHVSPESPGDVSLTRYCHNTEANDWTCGTTTDDEVRSSQSPDEMTFKSIDNKSLGRHSGKHSKISRALWFLTDMVSAVPISNRVTEMTCGKKWPVEVLNTESPSTLKANYNDITTTDDEKPSQSFSSTFELNKCRERVQSVVNTVVRKSRQPIPTDRYKSYTRPKSHDPFVNNVGDNSIEQKGNSMSNPNYERHFFRTLKKLQRPKTLNITKPTGNLSCEKTTKNTTSQVPRFRTLE